MSSADVATVCSLWRFDAGAALCWVAAFAAIAKLRPPLSRALSLGAAAGTATLALSSPIAVLADGYSFSAHMIQHLLLVLVVPLLAWIGVHRGGPVEGAPPPLRDESPRASQFGALMPPWLTGVAAMWIWHAPALCDAAAANALVHRVQEASLVLMGAWFWAPLLGRTRVRPPPLAGAVYLFAACVACTVLGIIVTFSPVEVCSVYAHPVDRLGILPLLRNEWGLTPERDQQLGGLLMWVPPCLVYGGGILALVAHAFRSPAEWSARPAAR